MSESASEGAWANGPLAYKPDWPAAQKRWKAFWAGDAMDRPLIDVKARPAEKPGIIDVPPPAPEKPEDLYFDPETVLGRLVNSVNGFENTVFVGESVPMTPFMLGGYALGCGPDVGFSEQTVWHPVLMSSVDDPNGYHPGPDDPWRQKMDKVLQRLLEAAPGKFLVGDVCQVMVNDLLALLRGTQDFLIDLIENIDGCVRRLKEMLPLWAEEVEHFDAIIKARQDGWTFPYPGLWDDEPFMGSQSDMSCMISTELFDAYVVPELDFVAERWGRIWYHLDGVTAMHHLPRLLSLPYIRCVQFVPGMGNPFNGPEYIDMYRQIQAAGRCLDLEVPPGNMEYIIRNLRPEGLILRTRIDDEAEARQLLDNAVRWAGSDVAAGR